jgi:thymidylate kinase
MAFIAFLGCDGSGKSTVIDRIVADFRAQGVEVRRGHWRPAPFDARRDASAAANDPHAVTPRGRAGSVAKLGWLACSWWVGWFRGLRRSAKGNHLIFDRYHADLLVDPRRYRYGGPMAVARLASKLMPQPDLVVFLDAEPELLYARKREVSLDCLAAARTRYLELCRSHPRFSVVDASKPVDEVVAAVMRKIQLLNL